MDGIVCGRQDKMDCGLFSFPPSYILLAIYSGHCFWDISDL